MERTGLLDHPVFGPLTLCADCGPEISHWRGRARLAALAGCRARKRFGYDAATRCVTLREDPDGTAQPLQQEFDLEVNDPDGSGPTLEQERAFGLLREGGAAVLRAALSPIARLADEVYFPQKLDHHRGPDSDGFLGQLTELATADGVRDMVDLRKVTICREAEGGVSLVALNFACTFDEEHGGGPVDRRPCAGGPRV
jgi:hypothetical protein